MISTYTGTLCGEPSLPRVWKRWKRGFHHITTLNFSCKTRDILAFKSPLFTLTIKFSLLPYCREYPTPDHLVDFSVFLSSETDVQTSYLCCTVFCVATPNTCSIFLSNEYSFAVFWCQL